MTVAGSDSCAGAGIQADLKTFTHHGVHGLTAVTCVVAEVPGLVRSLSAVSPATVRDQVSLGLEWYPVRAAKTGMLYSASLIDAFCEAWEASPAGRRPPLVVDPVMVASSGDSLLQPDAIRRYRDRLLPLAALVTPNLDETAVLLGRRPGLVKELAAAGEELVSRFGVPFLMKGGHLGGTEAVDVLIGAGEPRFFSAPFVRDASTHGTGCTLSAAITAALALGQDLPSAVAGGKEFITRAIRDALTWTEPRAVSALRQW